MPKFKWSPTFRSKFRANYTRFAVGTGGSVTLSLGASLSPSRTQVTLPTFNSELEEAWRNLRDFQINSTASCNNKWTLTCERQRQRGGGSIRRRAAARVAATKLVEGGVAEEVPRGRMMGGRNEIRPSESRFIPIPTKVSPKSPFSQRYPKQVSTTIIVTWPNGSACQRWSWAPSRPVGAASACWKWGVSYPFPCQALQAAVDDGEEVHQSLKHSSPRQG